MFDAYTVKKVLPRLFIAIILIQLSWFLFTGVIQAVNLVAYGIEGLIYAPFGGIAGQSLGDILSQISGGSGLGLFSVVAAGTGAVIAAVAVGGVLMTAGIVLLGVVIAFALLLFRQVIIIGLLIVAPLALVAWVLPSTEKYWKMWWDSFFKLLLVYPIIVAMIATGRVLASVVAGVDPGSGTWSVADDIVTFFLVIACIIGPFYLIPKTFQMAGGVFQTLTGAINNKGAGAFDRMRKRRGATVAKNWSDTKSGQRFGDSSALARRTNSLLQKGSHINKVGLRGLVSPGTAKSRLATATSGASINAIQEGIEKNHEFAQVKNDDDLLSAGINGGSEADVRRFLENRGRQTGRAFNDQDVAAVMAARRSMGNNFAAAAVVAKSGTGTGYAGKNGAGEMTQDIINASHGDRNMEATLFASAKSTAQSARRYDIAGTGFGTFFEQREALRSGQSTTEQVSEAMYDNSLLTQGAGAVLAGRSQSAENFVPALQRRMQSSWNNLQEAHNSGDAERIDQAQREFTQNVAATEALIDVAGQSSPENAKILADGVHSQQLHLDQAPAGMRDWLATQASGDRTLAPDMTVKQMMDHLGSRGGAYDEMRRNYGSSYQRETAQQQASAGGPATGTPTGPTTGII